MKKTNHEGLDEWADKIAALEPDVPAAVARYALRLASDRRLPKDDRDFAKAQADAVRRAVRRAKAKRCPPAKGKKK
ncbi:MAG TPA: hypothetical protein VMV69_28575 [Pirellulales bacterium]|nr:hypothetical protein [Pirellulales bacterium]